MITLNSAKINEIVLLENAGIFFFLGRVNGVE